MSSVDLLNRDDWTTDYDQNDDLNSYRKRLNLRRVNDSSPFTRAGVFSSNEESCSLCSEIWSVILINTGDASCGTDVRNWGRENFHFTYKVKVSHKALWA